MHKPVMLSLLGLLFGIPVLMLGLNIWVIASSSPYVISDIGRLPHNDVGLLLGTSRYTRNGHSNPHFHIRVSAAVALYRAGKVNHLLVSGANPSRHYNEPREMYQALVRAGVPEQAITLDFAGFRTLDSVIRAHAVFGLSRYTIISQRYHDYRAVFLARHEGIDAVAYAPAHHAPARALIQVEAREYLARVRAVLDVFVLHTQPRFLGPPVAIPRQRPQVVSPLQETL